MTTILPGTQVQARRLTWEVVHVEPAGEQQRFRLRCLQGSLRGHELDLLSPFEEITPITTDLDPARPGRLRDWRLYHQAFLLEQALGPAALLAVQPGRLEIAPYQLVPVMRALEMSRPRLLLADGVGLGKTVEAGLVITELIARRRAHRILIVSPAGPLLSQWNREMRSRFGLRFQTVRDAGELQELRRSLVLGANPFDHVSYCLTSIDFAKQEKVLQELERTSWDLVVIDEAHHCVRLGTAGDWEDHAAAGSPRCSPARPTASSSSRPPRTTATFPTSPPSWSFSPPAFSTAGAPSGASATAATTSGASRSTSGTLSQASPSPRSSRSSPGGFYRSLSSGE
jgi:hypothetical protein